MTEPRDDGVRQALQATMADRVATLGPPPAAVYEQVRRRHRRSRRRAVAVAAVLVALVAAGVPLVVTAGDDPRPPTTARPETRGSLAGDTALIDEAVRLLLDQQSPYRIDRDTVRVPYAEEYDGYRVVLAVGVARPAGVVVTLQATSAPGQPLRADVGMTGTPQPAIDARLGQQYTDPEHVLTRVTIGDRSFGLALFPAGSRATVRRGAVIGADCGRVEAAPVALPLQDGGAFFPVDGSDAPYVEVTDARGRRLIARALEPSGSSPPVQPLPPDGEIAADLAETLRGNAGREVPAELAGYATSFAYGTGVGELPERYVGVWAGPLPSGSGFAALWGGRYRSGATVLTGMSTDPGGNGYSGWVTGCFPAGALDRTVVAARLTDQPGRPMVIVAPPSAVRAEMRLAAGAPVSVDLVDGGGYYRGGGTVVSIRALDAQGRQVATGVPGRGFVGIPIQPR